MANEFAIKVENVSMCFNMSKERLDSLKEYFIKLMRRQLNFTEFYALKDVSFEIPCGQVCGIVGLNGSGKSTLLKVISGILKPTVGKATTIGSISPLIELGAGFDMELTARENIFLNGAVLGYSKKMMEDKFDEIIEFAELQDFVDVVIKNFSSGMVARLGFAIATITKPDILIVDEILAVGDFLFQQKCERRIHEMMAGGTTVVIVSHSIDQIERLCQRVIWLEKGRIRMDGPVEPVCNAYKGL
ncbi:MAG: ABC transporter ATP-binding protein [Firmicutes bacterium]|nr:ABC transporter ATP-binding protein [Bacillota bacterium]